jgi:hypothetical protein
MSNQLDGFQPRPDPLDELVTQLLECGGALSQMICHMVKFEASGLGADNVVPIPEVAHSLVRDVLRSVRKEHSKRDIRIAARIVEEATDRIANEIFLMSPDFIEEVRNRRPQRGRRPAC